MRARKIVIASVMVLGWVRVGAWAHADTPTPTATNATSGARPMVRVHGAARIDANAARSDGDLVLSGTLRDDAGDPLAGEPVLITLARGEGELQVRLDGAAAPRNCGDKLGPSPRVDDNAALTAHVDEAGRFCVRLTLPVDRYTARLTSKASALLDSARADIALDLARRSLLLRFDPPPRVISLDSERVRLDALAIVNDNGVSAAAEGLTLTLMNERGTQLGSSVTSHDGHAHFALDPLRLGAPGKGELHLAFAGDDTTSHGEHVAPIERHTRVQLELEEPPVAASAEDGIPISVRATSRAGEVPSGTLEVRAGEAAAGAATIEHGRARVVAVFDPPPSATPRGSTQVSIAFLSDTPWYEAGDPLWIDLPIQGPSPWRHVPLLATALALGALLIAGRLSGKRLPPPLRTGHEAKALPPGPSIDLVRAALGDGEGWSGKVIDAHDRAPVAAARVSIEIAGFTETRLTVTTVTDAAGQFVLPPQIGLREASLRIEARLHASLRKPLPPPGELSIAIVSRRRILLARLVEWAKARGKPFDARPEPTPRHVRDVAGGETPAGRWAEAVESAAFGAADVDASAEDEVDRIKP